MQILYRLQRPPRVSDACSNSPETVVAAEVLQDRPLSPAVVAQQLAFLLTRPPHATVKPSKEPRKCSVVTCLYPHVVVFKQARRGFVWLRVDDFFGMFVVLESTTCLWKKF